MPIPDLPLSMIYIRQIAEQVRNSGADVAHWLARSELSAAQLADPTLQLAYPALRQLIVDAQDLSGEPALGLLIGARLVANTHGILGYAAVSSSTLRQAVDLLEHYLRLRTTLVLLSHEIHGNQFRLVFTEAVPLGDIRRPVLEAIILTVKNLLDQLIMGSGHISQIAFPFAAPDYLALAEELFNCPLCYEQNWSGMVLPLELIDAPLKMADATTYEDAVQICQKELNKLLRNESLSAQVRRIMLQQQSGFPSLTVMARLLHLTPRTLHRRLVLEQTSYQEIIDDIRHVLAVEYLKSDTLTMQEISYSLGYSDMANFRRAFKRWEKVAPSLYRRLHN